MKRLHAVLLLLSLLFSCVLLPACDSTPSNVVIGDDELHSNPPGEGEGNEGGENGGETTPGEDGPDSGIGENEAVDLPFVPV